MVAGGSSEGRDVECWIDEPIEVFWEDDPEKKRAVLGLCQRCKATREVQWNGGDFHIVSPMGTAHWGAEHNEGYTACGIDATGENWWWRT
jgi:hypothetical protein